MTRAIDEPIPPEEWLYLGVTAENIGSNDSVLAAAVDLQGQSVNRQKYNPNPAAAILAQRGHSAAAGVQPMNLPATRTETGVDYYFHADDLPIDENPAHAEIRLHRPGKGFNENHRPSAPNRTLLKELLASQLKVVVRQPPASATGSAAAPDPTPSGAPTPVPPSTANVGFFLSLPGPPGPPGPPGRHRPKRKKRRKAQREARRRNR